MPQRDQAREAKSLQQVVDELDAYPLDAFHFVQQGLAYTVDLIHGQPCDPEESRHISGQQLCDGLRDYALQRWGLLARTVLARWNIRSTLDFGRIVFAMVDSGLMHKTEQDSIEDFREVFDFRHGFETQYRIPVEQSEKATEGRL